MHAGINLGYKWVQGFKKLSVKMSLWGPTEEYSSSAKDPRVRKEWIQDPFTGAQMTGDKKKTEAAILKILGQILTHTIQSQHLGL